MPQTINTNVASLNAQRNLNGSQSSLATSMQRLSSGLRVNSAKDDAAGLAIAERMNAQVKGMNVAIRNSNDGISMAQTAEGSLGKINDSLQRMRELAVQAANGTVSGSDQVSLQKEFKQLQQEITRVTDNTRFNGKQILKNDDNLIFQVGAGTDTAASGGEGNTITVDAVNMSTDTDVSSAVDVANTKIGDDSGTTPPAVQTNDQIQAVIDKIDKAMDKINDTRATFGATQNRFEAVISNLQTSVENQSASRGRIMDADFAVETSNLSRSQILQQAGTAMIAQANQLPQGVLSLLR